MKRVREWWRRTLAHEIFELVRRWWCRRWGHDWRQDGGEESPVLPPIVVCRRCGKFERLLKAIEVSRQ